MKLILTIIRDSDNEPVSQALIKAGFRVRVLPRQEV